MYYRLNMYVNTHSSEYSKSLRKLKGSSAGMMKGNEKENGMMLATRYVTPECIHHVIYV